MDREFEWMLNATDLAMLLGVEETWLTELLPGPVQGVPAGRPCEGGLRPGYRWFVAGKPAALVVIGVSTELVVVGVPVVDWHGPGTPVLRTSREEVAERECLAFHRDAGRAWLKTAIRDARVMRERRFRVCVRCGERNPPEWMDSLDRWCHECAAREGAVF